MRAALGLELQAGNEGVEHAERVTLDGALVGAVVLQADVALQAERDGVVERKRQDGVGGLLDGCAAGAGAGIEYAVALFPNDPLVFSSLKKSMPGW